jgi:CRISPR-associated endonuclease Csn1
VQKLSSKFYEFRLNTEASIKQSFLPFYRRITGYGEGIGGWLTHNPLKVKISVSGKIEKL